MSTRTVSKRARRVDKRQKKSFLFSREMVEAISGNGNVPEFIKEYRSLAWDEFEKLPIPTTSEEAWRRTNLRRLPVDEFFPVSMENLTTESLFPIDAELIEPLVGDIHGGQIVFTNEEVQVELSSTISAKGVIFTDLITAERQHPDLLSLIMGKIVKSGEGKFAALAAAMSQKGVFLYVPQGVHVELPLHSVIWAPGKDLAFFSHILVWLEEGSSVTYLHEAASPNEQDGQALHAGLVEIYVGQGANLRFVELQSWGEHVWNFSHERARIDRDANLDWIFGAIGSHVTKNFSNIDLIGQGATGRMSGFYFTDGVQHFDHDTQQNHLAPNTMSDLLFKGALREHSRSVWQGMIYVAPGAQKTDGYQANRNLILDSNARADSIPGLEILADDVRCTHGATIGKIDPDQVFYLRSRGIPYKDAERLIVEGFFDPIMQRIPFGGVRTRFQDEILKKMG